MGSQSPLIPGPQCYNHPVLARLLPEMMAGPLSVLLTHCLPLGLTHSQGSINVLNGK